MRYLAKTDDGRTVGGGRTIKTAVDRARERDGEYVVDDLTGVIQWRKPEAGKPSPSWYATVSAGGHQGLIADENDPTGRTIALTYDPKDAALIVRAVNAHAGMVAALRGALGLLSCNCGPKCDGTCTYAEGVAALRAAGEEV